jgi:hypothetical protein
MFLMLQKILNWLNTFLLFFRYKRRKKSKIESSPLLVLLFLNNSNKKYTSTLSINLKELRLKKKNISFFLYKNFTYRRKATPYPFINFLLRKGFLTKQFYTICVFFVLLILFFYFCLDFIALKMHNYFFYNHYLDLMFEYSAFEKKNNGISLTKLMKTMNWKFYNENADSDYMTKSTKIMKRIKQEDNEGRIKYIYEKSDPFVYLEHEGRYRLYTKKVRHFTYYSPTVKSRVHHKWFRKGLFTFQWIYAPDMRRKHYKTYFIGKYTIAHYVKVHINLSTAFINQINKTFTPFVKITQNFHLFNFLFLNFESFNDFSDLPKDLVSKFKMSYFYYSWELFYLKIKLFLQHQNKPEYFNYIYNTYDYDIDACIYGKFGIRGSEVEEMKSLFFDFKEKEGLESKVRFKVPFYTKHQYYHGLDVFFSYKDHVEAPAEAYLDDEAYFDFILRNYRPIRYNYKVSYAMSHNFYHPRVPRWWSNPKYVNIKLSVRAASAKRFFSKLHLHSIGFEQLNYEEQRFLRRWSKFNSLFNRLIKKKRLAAFRAYLEDHVRYSISKMRNRSLSLDNRIKDYQYALKRRKRNLIFFYRHKMFYSTFFHNDQVKKMSKYYDLFHADYIKLKEKSLVRARRRTVEMIVKNARKYVSKNFKFNTVWSYRFHRPYDFYKPLPYYKVPAGFGGFRYGPLWVFPYPRIHISNVPMKFWNWNWYKLFEGDLTLKDQELAYKEINYRTELDVKHDRPKHIPYPYWMDMPYWKEWAEIIGYKFDDEKKDEKPELSYNFHLRTTQQTRNKKVKFTMLLNFDEYNRFLLFKSRFRKWPSISKDNIIDSKLKDEIVCFLRRTVKSSLYFQKFKRPYLYDYSYGYKSIFLSKEIRKKNFEFRSLREFLK